jgi:hypothetical protein
VPGLANPSVAQVYKKKRDGQSHPVFSLDQFEPLVGLEEELHGELDNASSLLFGGYAKVVIRLSKLLGYGVLHKVQVQVAAVERVQRMI